MVLAVVDWHSDDEVSSIDCGVETTSNCSMEPDGDGAATTLGVDVVVVVVAVVVVEVVVVDIFVAVVRLDWFVFGCSEEKKHYSHHYS